ncbi:hypothetical protein AhaeINNSZ174_10955 [Acinetobacter haemolyticus]|nr:hypothetical protein [Acinetobacter haemolyticus]NAS03705.1 hypothetical protein [Acinetobacter haemolyticus]NAS08450.1 hypothetical protein [Acinetobacter haemolyticus]QHI29952.1 hypothetical protein AhaeINNSZ174_10955 [Acinetobacter haemolyticus]QHI32304.1 hypothetical protein Ahae11616_06405 [Acinetobacter haemolyticus]
MNHPTSNSNKTLRPIHWALVVGSMILLLAAGILFNQHQQRQTDLKLAQLALEQSKLQNQTESSTEVDAVPDTLSPVQAVQDTELDVSTDETTTANSLNSNLADLSMTVDQQYHEDKTLSSNPSSYGLKPMKSAPEDLKAIVAEINPMLRAHLMDEWGRASADQLAKRVDGWTEQADSLTYRTAWDSDRYQCTWYVVRWDKRNNQILNQGYLPCF